MTLVSSVFAPHRFNAITNPTLNPNPNPNPIPNPNADPTLCAAKTEESPDT